MKNETVIGTDIESIDLAALLIALDFPLIDVHVIEGVNIDSAGKNPKNTMSWKFCDKSTDGKYSVDKVRAEWKMPKEFTLDVLKLSRLLAHNLSVVKKIAKRPQNAIYTDMGGIGVIGDRQYRGNSKDLPISNHGFGGVCDSDTIALAVTLGVVPNNMYVSGGRLYMTFFDDAKSIGLNDVVNMMRDERLRNVANTNPVAVLACQLDNRSVILENMDKMRRKVRLIADGGETQVLFEKGRLSEENKKRIQSYLG